MFKRTNDARQCLVTFDNQARMGLEQFMGHIPSAYKGTTQTVSASTTIVTDNDLNVQLQTGVHLVIYELLTPSMTAAGGLKLQVGLGDGLTVNGATGINGYATFSAAASSATTIITAAATPVNGGTATVWLSCRVMVSVDVVNPGMLLFQWAQQAASGATSIGIGSTVNVVTVAP
jgi:hypothetical protein